MSSFYYKESAQKNARKGFCVWLFYVPVSIAILIIFRETHPVMFKLVGVFVIFIGLFSLFLFTKFLGLRATGLFL